MENGLSSFTSGLQIVSMGDNQGRLVYARPRVPSKAEGRRGTRRAWKRANPPGIYMATVSRDWTPDGGWSEGTERLSPPLF